MRDRMAKNQNAPGAEGRRQWATLWTEIEGAQLVEFALAMPMMVVLLVGIIDFGSAFNLRQKLNNAAREASRFGSALKCSDCTQTGAGQPRSTMAIRDVVEAYLTNAGVRLCGTAGTTSATPISGQTFAWTFTYSSSPCSATAPFVMTIERSYTYTYTDTVNGGTKTVVGSRVTLSYPYTWAFSRVIGLMGVGASPALPSTITSDAVMQNEN